jgi:hypothetical protein
LVFGGGRVGLMGILADSVLSAGGQAIGVMARALVEKEIAHTSLTELHVVGFLRSAHKEMLIVEEDPVRLLGRLEVALIPSETKWVEPGER